MILIKIELMQKTFYINKIFDAKKSYAEKISYIKNIFDFSMI